MVMKRKKRTFLKTVFLTLVSNDRWLRNPKNKDKYRQWIQLNSMIGFTWIILICFVMSCAPAQKIEKSSLKSDIDKVTNVSKKTDEKQTGSVIDTSIKTADKNTESSEIKNKTTETKTTRFDGSKPIVPGTGKPPVIEEIIKTETESNQKDIRIQETLTEKLNLQISYTRELQIKLDSMMKVNSSLISKTSLAETTVSHWWKWLLAGVGIGLIGMCFILKIPFVMRFLSGIRII